MKKYKVITLCGSTRFKKEFMRIQKELTLKGYIVLSVGLFGHSGDNEVWENMDPGTLTKTKEMLDDMHKRKIDMASEIFVINVNGYIGDSTKSEIAYAKEHGKIIRFLEGTDKDSLINNIHMLHTTQLSLKRIKNNLHITQSVIPYLKDMIKRDDSIIIRKGKNYYCIVNNIRITINAYNYCIITAHKIKEVK